MRMGAYSRWALIRGWALIIFISLKVFFFFFHSLFTFLFLNKLLYLLWTVTAIFVFVIDNFAHVVLLTLTCSSCFWKIKLALAMALFVAHTKEVSVC